MDTIDHDPDQTVNTKRSQLTWFQPVSYAFLATLAILGSGFCCWSPLVNLFLPVPSCMGGYGADNAQDVRTQVFFDMVGLGIGFPFALILSTILGWILYVIFRSRRSAKFVKWSAALAGFLIGLGFGIAIPVIISRTMCNL